MRRAHNLMRLARAGWGYRNWYRDIRPALDAMSSHLNTTPGRLADVLAVTSPRCSVTRNVRVTYSYLTTGHLPRDVTRNTRAALDHYEQTGRIRGPKTSEFARALRGDEDAIVIDTWMSVALGIEQRSLRRKAVRHSAARRIRYCAHVLGVTPAQVQAAIWAGTVLKAGPNRNVPSMERVMKEIIA